MTAPPPSVREYEASAETTQTFGRVRVGIREHRLTVDGPVQNGCPGEEPTPAELFLAAVASCGAELVQVIARESDMPVGALRIAIRGTVDRSRQQHVGVTTFTEVGLDFTLANVDEGEAASLVDAFTRR